MNILCKLHLHKFEDIEDKVVHFEFLPMVGLVIFSKCSRCQKEKYRGLILSSMGIVSFKISPELYKKL